MPAETPRTSPRAVAVGTVAYIIDICANVLALLRLPLVLLITITTLIAICLTASNAFVRVVQANTPSPCDVLIFARLAGPVCDTPDASQSQALVVRADFPALAKVQSIVLDRLMNTSASGTELSLSVKHAELAVKDLVALVLESNITAREDLANALTNVAIDARSTGRRLQTLSSHINGVFDSIASYNAYALQTLAAAKLSRSRDVGATLSSTFKASMDAFSSQITRIIVDASVTMTALDALESRLYEVHELCVRESVATSIALDDVLWELWTMLGGNQAQIRDLRHREGVLKEVGYYRAVAVAYVTAASQTLEMVDAGLAELRDRLSDYSVNPRAIPIEVHIASLEYSMRRMEARARGGGSLRTGAAAIGR